MGRYGRGIEDKGIMRRVSPRFVNISKKIAPNMSLNDFSKKIAEEINKSMFRENKIILLKIKQENLLYGKKNK